MWRLWIPVRRIFVLEPDPAGRREFAADRPPRLKDHKRLVWMDRCLAARARRPFRTRGFCVGASGRSPLVERGPHPRGAATGIVKPWPKVGKPHVAAACLNAGDSNNDADSEKTP